MNLIADRQRSTAGRLDPGPGDLVVCSLEPWDDVWRRNQFLVNALLHRSAGRRTLFVEPPSDVLFDLASRRRSTMPSLRSLRSDGRLYALRPLKLLPRRLGDLSDRLLRLQVLAIARRLGFTHPTLWLNDVTYAPLIHQTDWPTVYDVTDDWLLAPFPPREIRRLRKLDALALIAADEVVVCSPALAASRGGRRRVTVIPNAVDLTHFGRARARPADLSPAPSAVYVGTLHESRLDVELVCELARAMPALSIALIGPDALRISTRRVLLSEPNVHILGKRPYEVVPAYLQHADIIIVPHTVTPFTEALDPIKAYECLAIHTPTVATPVAGFRELADWLTIVPRVSFVDAVRRTLASGTISPRGRPAPPTWSDRANEFGQVLTRAASRGQDSR